MSDVALSSPIGFVLRLLPTLLSAIVIALAGLAALHSSSDSRPRPSAATRPAWTVAPEPQPSEKQRILVIVDSSASPEVTGLDALSDQNVFILDVSVGEAAIAETVRELVFMEVPVELIDLRGP